MKETLLRVETDERSHIEDSEMVPCAVNSVFLVHSERSIKGVEPYISAFVQHAYGSNVLASYVCKHSRWWRPDMIQASMR